MVFSLYHMQIPSHSSLSENSSKKKHNKDHVYLFVTDIYSCKLLEKCAPQRGQALTTLSASNKVPLPAWSWLWN